MEPALKPANNKPTPHNRKLDFLTMFYWVVGFIGIIVISILLSALMLTFHYPLYDLPLLSISFFGLVWHGYGILFYLVVFTFILIPLFRHKAVNYFLMLWAFNEATFNLVYVLRYPSALDVMLTYDHWWAPYLIILFGLGATSFVLTKPKLHLSIFSLVFPCFLIGYFLIGVPIMEPFNTPISPSLPQNFLWELAFQVTLIWSFIATTKKTKLQKTEEQKIVQN